MAERTVRTNELAYMFLYTTSPTTFVSTIMVEAPADATYNEVFRALTIENTVCWHNTQNCGCVIRRDIIRLDHVGRMWHAITESEHVPNVTDPAILIELAQIPYDANV